MPDDLDSVGGFCKILATAKAEWPKVCAHHLLGACTYCTKYLNPSRYLNPRVLHFIASALYEPTGG